MADAKENEALNFEIGFFENIISRRPDFIAAARPEIAAPLDAWLQRLCTFDPAQRPAASKALEDLGSGLGGVFGN